LHFLDEVALTQVLHNLDRC
jgi:hypothetical protein